MPKYKRGDIVSLISIGMPMTITGVFVDNTDDMNINIAYEAYRKKFGCASPAFYSCSWFERKANKENVSSEESLNQVIVENNK